MAEGGNTLSQFKQIIRTGIDLDGIHPNCTAAQIAALNNPPAGATLATFPDFVCIPTGVIPMTTFDNEPARQSSSSDAVGDFFALDRP